MSRTHVERSFLALLAVCAIGALGYGLFASADASDEQETAQLWVVERDSGGEARELEVVGDGEAQPVEASAVAAPDDGGFTRSAGSVDAGEDRSFTVRLRVIERVVVGGSARTRESPIAGARVERARARRDRAGDRPEIRWSAEPSKDDGEIAFTAAPEGAATPSTYELIVEAEGFIPGRVVIRTDELEAGEGPVRVLALERTARVRVLVSGDVPPGGGVLRYWYARDARSSGGDGRIEWNGEREIVLDGLLPGPLSVALATQERPVATRFAIVTTPGDTTVVDLVVTSGETIRGTVIDLESKRPFPGVVVRPRPRTSGLNDEVARRAIDEVATDAQGRFELRGIPLGQMEVDLVTPDGVAHEREILVLEGNAAREYTLRVRGTASLEGRVVANGVSLDGLEVVVTTKDVARRVYKRRGDDPGLRTPSSNGTPATVAPDGTFRFEAVPSGRTLVVQAASLESAIAAVELEPLGLGETKSAVELTLTPTEPVRVRVTCDRGELPSTVALTVHGAAPSGGGRWSGDASVEVGPGGECVVESDLASIDHVRIDAPGFLRLDEAWPEGESIPTFELRRALRVEVDVTGTYGAAIPRARISATPVDAEEPSGERRRRRRRGPEDRASRWGHASLDLDPDVEWTLSVTAFEHEAERGLPVVPDANGLARMHVALEPAPPVQFATVRGSIARAGSGAPLPDVRFDGMRGGSARIDGTRFEIVGAVAGDMDLIARSPGYETVRIDVGRIAPGEVKDVGEVLVRAATVVEVRVEREDGRAVRDARVRLKRLPAAKGGRDELPREVRFPDRSSRTGVYRREAVGRAKWTLVVERRGYQRFSREIEVKGLRIRPKVVLKAR